ncbi:hypothetical protein LUZ63_019861 [Rhynchospora breviuscula]|uniref:RING-type domain-containing protein n=1 Tax=Rhynchospora breviuscula TaxID=2022672 RepID=A0A9Q0C718_9POAL|nr:hypothetical protein LUZ63_019861 [Rhynchospora breviuscula]
MPVQGEGAGSPPTLYITRLLARASRSRWYIFLRHVYRYQNGTGPGSELSSSPFNSPAWLSFELAVLLTQIVITTVVMTVSNNERPFWPLRIWIFAYDVANLLSLPLLYWRHRHAAEVGNSTRHAEDVEQQGRNDQLPRTTSYLMNKSRSCLELFYAMWFVMGNVWVFDSRLGTFNKAPKLHALCISLLAWNAIIYTVPFLLFLLLCCFVPMVNYILGYNMNLASLERGASDEQLSELPQWRFKGTNKSSNRRDENSECCICLAKYKERDELRQLPCSHVFHQQCVDRWLRIISSCPLCKQELKK